MKSLLFFLTLLSFACGNDLKQHEEAREPKKFKLPAFPIGDSSGWVTTTHSAKADSNGRFMWPDQNSPTGWTYHGPVNKKGKWEKDMSFDHQNKKKKWKSSLVGIDDIGSFGSEPGFTYDTHPKGELPIDSIGYIHVTGTIAAVMMNYSGEIPDSVHWNKPIRNCKCDFFDWIIRDGANLLAYKKQDSAMVIRDTIATIKKLVNWIYIENKLYKK